MRRSGAIALLLLLVTAAPASAVTLNDVEDELMCDTCNVPLNIAQSPRADQERAEIRRLIAQGKSKQQILDTFEAEYGPNVLADPKGGASATATWLVPALVLVSAVLAVAVALRHWRRRRRTGADREASGADDLPSEDRERLERDLALYDL